LFDRRDARLTDRRDATHTRTPAHDRFRRDADGADDSNRVDGVPSAIHRVGTGSERAGGSGLRGRRAKRGGDDRDDGDDDGGDDDEKDSGWLVEPRKAP
jgi:hypothetical protein